MYFEELITSLNNNEPELRVHAVGDALVHPSRNEDKTGQVAFIINNFGGSSLWKAIFVDKDMGAAEVLAAVEKTVSEVLGRKFTFKPRPLRRIKE